MKHAISVLAVALIVAVPVAAQTDIIAKLGSSTEEAHDAIFSAFSSGSVYMAGLSDVFKTAGAQARVALVTAAINFARAYTGTSDFARRYGVFREEQNPTPDASTPADAASLNAEQRKGIQ
jgi:hypothetical protein